MSVYSLFVIIEKAKMLGSYHVANLGFAALIDAALDLEQELHFIWEKDQNDDYYDLLSITDGLRTVRMPAPLLKNPDSFKEICSQTQYRRRDQEYELNPEIILMKDIKQKLAQLASQILNISPNCVALASKYFVKRECGICTFFDKSRAIHCSINPSGYPGVCHDFEINLNSDLQHEDYVNWAKQVQIAQVENTGEKRYISLGDFRSFSEIPWKSGDYTLSGSRRDKHFSVCKSDGNPSWIWYFVSRKLTTWKKGESRWLIGKGCDASSFYEVWIIPDSTAKVEPLLTNNYPDQNSWWLPTVLDEYEESENYEYEDSPLKLGKWKGHKAIPFKNIHKTCQVLQHLTNDSKDPFYSDRWLVWNYKAKIFDVLYPARPQ